MRAADLTVDERRVTPVTGDLTGDVTALWIVVGAIAVVSLGLLWLVTR